MKTLILLRHGKSDWTAGKSDHARPLNIRGRLAAPLMGAWLSESGLVPDAALISTAARTRETWERLRALLPEAPEPEYRDELYLAEPDTLLAAIRGAGTARRLLVLGHNPGIESFAMLLAGPTPQPIQMPTCAVAALDFDIAAWQEARFGAARLVANEVPKALV